MARLTSFVLIVLLLVGCQAEASIMQPTSTSLPPTATSTQASPTDTPSPPTATHVPPTEPVVLTFERTGVVLMIVSNLFDPVEFNGTQTPLLREGYDVIVAAYTLDPLPDNEGGPHLEVDTKTARKILGSQVGLRDAIAQWGNTAALVAGLFRQDWDIIARSVEDRVAEPLRAPYVPGFRDVKEAALRAGALAASLSGSGPSLFALCRGRERAEVVGKRMVEEFRTAAGLDADLTISSGRASGARILAV